jgi:hypothetical protein
MDDRYGLIVRRAERRPRDVGAVPEFVTAQRRRFSERAEGGAADEQQMVRADIASRPDAPDVHQYAVPVESFGAELLRRAGWAPGAPIGRGADAASEGVRLAPRPPRLGLGATPRAAESSGQPPPSHAKASSSQPRTQAQQALAQTPLQPPPGRMQVDAPSPVQGGQGRAEKEGQEFSRERFEAVPGMQWAMVGLRVRVVDDSVGGGGLLRRQCAVRGVAGAGSPRVALAVGGGGREVAVPEAAIETVVPRVGEVGRVVRGRMRGSRGQCVERDRDREQVLLLLRHPPADDRAVRVRFDDVCVEDFDDGEETKKRKT